MPAPSFRSLLPSRGVRVIAGLMLSAACIQLHAAPQVAASIPPLQLIAAAVMDGVGEPLLALGAGQDPHSISLRPSERRTLAEADLVLWVGPALELPLVDILQNDTERLLTAQDIAGMKLVPGGDEVDPHLWLDLGNATRIASALSQRLAALDPSNAARYAANAERFEATLMALRHRIEQELERARPSTWAVYHHAFIYMEQELALPAALSLTDSNGTMAGLRTLMGLRAEMQRARLACLVAEPGVDTSKVRNLLDLPTLAVREVDVMGADETVDASAYARMYETIVAAILECGAKE